ncbi:DUF397 domain-containing protein [Streptomyces sp. TRM 70361]|uniref:DUF397 domain-containing protein n=1 Tax=Streptomyces sp. TRM 70361 TaxID=3116553 RepID=UPI002E7AF2EB|nr:DUF397 domain-containing protein [Streptomyces sp. TRM 70361]MEE1939382.1 DUF397 domain-containing protein [Streptomyces sp. TRM 70361]
MKVDDSQLTWRKSSVTGQTGQCVEVAVSDIVHVRDSKDPQGDVLVFPRGGWALFLASVKGEGRTLPGSGRAVRAAVD